MSGIEWWDEIVDAGEEFVNETGEAAEEATGGAVSWEVGDDGVSGQVGGVEGSVDTGAGDGDVGVGVETEVMGTRVGVGAELATGDDQPEGQSGLDVGVQVGRSEVGVTANVDLDDEQAGVDVGGYGIDADGVRVEGGVTVNADASYGQAGVDGGVFVEQYGSDGQEDVRWETGVTANLDASSSPDDGARGGVDVGVFTDLDGDNVGDSRMETGGYVGTSVSEGSAMLSAGGFGEATSDSDERQELRVEGGLGAGIVATGDDGEGDHGDGAAIGVGSHLRVDVTDDGETDSRSMDFVGGVGIDDRGMTAGVHGHGGPDDDASSVSLGVTAGVDEGKATLGVTHDAAGENTDAEVGLTLDGGGNVGSYRQEEDGEREYSDGSHLDDEADIVIRSTTTTRVGDAPDPEPEPMRRSGDLGLTLPDERRGDAAERSTADADDGSEDPTATTDVDTGVEDVRVEPEPLDVVAETVRERPSEPEPDPKLAPEPDLRHVGRGESDLDLD